jgi:hypothetical protein
MCRNGPYNVDITVFGYYKCSYQETSRCIFWQLVQQHMPATKTYFYGYTCISCGTNNLPLVHIYHLKNEGPLLNVNHKICKITQTTTKFIIMADKSFDPFITKSFSSGHMYNDIFPFPSHIIQRQ